MKIAPLLRDLPIGADAAENDVNLAIHFVRTSILWSIVSDQADAILGAKGSGKSAIARHLRGSEFNDPQLSLIDIVPAFNLHGAIAFRKLGTDLDHLSETGFRALWLAYIVSLVGNHIVKTYPTLPESATLREALQNADLLDEENKQIRIWNRILQLVGNVMPRRVEAQFTIDPTGAPGVGATLQFGDKDASLNKIDFTRFDWYGLLEIAYNALRKVSRRCWVIFDRLDEAFPEDRTLEKAALRALLRTHLDLTSNEKTIRTKLILRTDLLTQSRWVKDSLTQRTCGESR